MKITIITVCFNAENEIRRTLNSVIFQTYKFKEIIIIDGNSTDRTMSIINEFRDKLNIVISEPDRGIYDAMNKGIRLSTGDYINFMNAGDTFFSSETLSKVVSYIQDKDFDVYFGDEIKKYEWGKILQKGDYINDNSTSLPFGHQSTFIKSSLMKTYEFDTSFRILADYNLINKLYLLKKSFYHIPLPISVYDMYGSSNNIPLIFKESSRIKELKGYKYYSRRILSYINWYVHRTLPKSILKQVQTYKYKNKILRADGSSN